ncbi:hypothetical protein PSHT_15046 [Puccinia striiformis]|uniref:30S ribosomal protein S15 n=1 Tax=Puccinia striiformis TaxID=27350 RepID=A0A2S4UH52_9BASI|nr:hypothetical protein PSHT_15046 [Puccinia striiformis]
MTQMIWNGLKNGLGSIKNTNQPSITARRGSLGSALGQTESFSTTGTLLIKTKKQKKEIERQRVKAQEAKTTNRTNLRLREKPDPILGYSTQMPKAHLSWENCELAQLIVKKEDVWAGKINPVPVLLNQDQKKPSKKTPSSTTTTDNTPTQDNNQSLVLNFGLDENEHQKAILFDGLPKIKELLKIKNKPIFDPSDFSTPSSSDPEEATSKMGSEEDEEDLKKLRLMRILDLQKLDPGCSEVQAAMLTYRIHTVLDHAWQNRRDKDSKRHLSDLVMKRMKILKYLKRVNPSSYFELLPRIGLQPKYLKDELIVRAKLPLRPGESLD